MTSSSEAIGNLAAALAAAQGELEGAVKGAVNPHFRSRYADLATVWEAWQAVGPKHGLALVQMPGASAGGVELTTRLMHKSGEWIERTAIIPLGKNDAQGYGSALTYARRYALAAFVGIAPEDDDGEAAVGRGKPAKPVAANEPVAVDVEQAAVTEAMRDWARQAKQAAANWNDEEAARAWADDKRNRKALEKLEAAAPELFAEVEKAIDARRSYLLERFARAG